MNQHNEAKHNEAQKNEERATLLVDSLIAAGLDFAIITLGSRNTPLILALERAAKQNGIKLMTLLDERVAAFVALGYARYSHKRAALFMTSGSAIANSFPAVVEAKQTQTPLLIVSADRPKELQGCHAPQTIDQVSFFGRYSDFSIDISDTLFSEHRMKTIALSAIQETEGVSHINISFRKPLWEKDSLYQKKRSLNSSALLKGKKQLSAEQLHALKERIDHARSGAIIVGPQYHQDNISALIDFAETLGWPLLVEAASNARFQEHRSDNLIMLGDRFYRSNFAKHWHPDLVIQIGHPPTTQAANRWIKENTASKAIQFNETSNYRDPNESLNLWVQADPKESLIQLSQTIEKRDPIKELTLLKRAQSACMTRIQKQTSFWEEPIIRTLLFNMADNALLHLANSSAIRDVENFGLSSKASIDIFSSRGANGIDGNLSTAIGEAIAANRPAYLLIGDLALLHDMGALLATQKADIDLTIVLIDNQGGGLFDQLPIAKHPTAFEEHFIAKENIDFKALCQAHRIAYQFIETIEAFEYALNQNKETRGMRLMHLRINRKHSLDARHAWWKNELNLIDQSFKQELEP